MLRTFDAPFDFHDPNGGRGNFEKLAAKIAQRIEGNPDIIVDPIFSYGIDGSDGFTRFAELDASRPAIVYLSNIVMHSSILILGHCDASELNLPLYYDSINAFLTSPFVRGFGVNRNNTLNSTFNDTTLVISDLATFGFDEKLLTEGNGMFRVLDCISDVYFFNVLNYEKYFYELFVNGDNSYFLLETKHAFRDLARRYTEDTLRDYLISSSCHFATLGDDHMDDEFAVSYGLDCWRIEDQVAFMR